MLAKVYTSAIFGIDAYLVEVEVDLSAGLPTILPEMTLDETLEVTKIHSITGNLSSEGGLLKVRPFRSPHHTTSDVALMQWEG